MVKRARRGIGRACRGKGLHLLFVPQQDPLRTGGGALARRGARAGKGGEGDDGRSNQPKHQRTNQSIIRQASSVKQLSIHQPGEGRTSVRSISAARAASAAPRALRSAAASAAPGAWAEGAAVTPQQGKKGAAGTGAGQGSGGL